MKKKKPKEHAKKMVMSFCIIITKEATKPLKPPPPSLVPFVTCGLGGMRFPKVWFRGGMELYSHQISPKGRSRGGSGGAGGDSQLNQC